ncbi:TVP38/TMEM64 family protein [Parvularcula sp. IMCC14364]|uniref:TVP38/TMEM64 family protein n=1 Tax=Parvularcula sp. IMCC14364 TaxID=3067902 RepID=UPI0027419234|nr:TVP38/TMEM64 family protein [Parvularcula sp. IMCC14364]
MTTLEQAAPEPFGVGNKQPDTDPLAGNKTSHQTEAGTTMSDTQNETPPQKKSIWIRLAPVGVIAVALILFFALGLNRYFNFDVILNNKEALDGWISQNAILATVLFGLAYAGAVAISFPGATIFTVVGGFLLGLWKGTIGVVFGATIGAVIIFMLAKTAFGDTLRSRAGSGVIKKMEAGFREDELSYMFLLRLVPAFPFFLVNIVAGLLDVKLRNYMIGTFFGIIPGTFVYVSIGNAIAAGTASIDDTGLASVFSQPSVYLPFIGLAFLGALPIIIKRVTGKKLPEGANAD